MGARGGISQMFARRRKCPVMEMEDKHDGLVENMYADKDT